MGELDGQVAIVTGGGRGIGQAIAHALAEAGAAVTVVSRTADQLAATVARINQAGGRALAVPADVTDPAAVEGFVAETERRFGSVDLLVNNAGMAEPFGPLWEVDLDTWWRNLEVNLRGPVLCSAAVLRGMVARRRGRIINVSSGVGNVPAPWVSAYGTARAALLRLTDSLAVETREHGVQVFVISPGAVRTQMYEALFATPETTRWIERWFAELSAGRGRRLPAAEVRAAMEQFFTMSPEWAAQLCVALASGRADALSGRYFAVPVDLDDLLERTQEIVADDRYTLRLRT